MPRSRLLVTLALLAAPAVLAPAAQADPPPVDCATTSGAYAAGVNCRQIEVDGTARNFLAYVPTTSPDTGRRRPVVVMYHGSSGSGGQFLNISGWREQADATGLVAVFPTGLRYRILENGRRSTKWNDGDLAGKVDLTERPAGYPADAPFPADDVGFTDAILADLDAHLPIDRRRLFASGFSNGADFTAHLAVERSTVLAAAGFSAGGLHGPAAPARPIPMAMSLGTRDDRMLALTGLATLPLDPVEILTQPVLDAELETAPGRAGPGPGAATGDRAAAADRARVAGGRPALPLHDAGGVRHQYPNGRNNPAGFAAAPEFWRFFAEHPLP